MNILILGGDGYMGWPIAMHLAMLGHTVSVMDNVSKRKWEMECGSTCLFGVPPLHRRVSRFTEVTGKEISFFVGDAGNVGAIYHIFDRTGPDVVIHCAGQSSAPFSMKSRTNAVLTFENNVKATLNVLHAIQRAEQEVHLIKIQGFLPPDKGPQGMRSFLRVSDQACADSIRFACENWRLSVALLNVGIVYGIDTKETILDLDLRASVHYDEIFGTILNRFLVQASIGHPLTVYGKGDVARWIVNLQDVVSAVSYLVEHGLRRRNVREVAVGSEKYSVYDMARIVRDRARLAGLPVEVQNIPNPRGEGEQDDPEGESLDSIPIEYRSLDQTLTGELFTEIQKQQQAIDPSIICQNIRWNRRVTNHVPSRE